MKSANAKMNFLLLLFCFLIVSNPGNGQESGSKEEVSDHKVLIGNREGKVNAGPMKFTFVFRFREDNKGMIKGTLDILEQNGIGIPIDEIIVRNDSLLLDLREMKRKYSITCFKPASPEPCRSTQR